MLNSQREEEAQLCGLVPLCVINYLYTHIYMSVQRVPPMVVKSLLPQDYTKNRDPSYISEAHSHTESQLVFLARVGGASCYNPVE